MSHDPAHEFTWPIFYHTFETQDSVPKSTVLAGVADPGDVAMLPHVHVVGRTVDGARGNILRGVYTAVNAAGIRQIDTDTEQVKAIGVGGLGITVELVVGDVQMIATGLNATRILWCVYWRAFEFLAPEE